MLFERRESRSIYKEHFVFTNEIIFTKNYYAFFVLMNSFLLPSTYTVTPTIQYNDQWVKQTNQLPKKCFIAAQWSEYLYNLYSSLEKKQSV